MNKRKQISSYYSVSEEKMSTKQKASEVTFSPAKKINCLNTDKYDHHDSQQGWKVNTVDGHSDNDSTRLETRIKEATCRSRYALSSLCAKLM